MESDDDFDLSSPPEVPSPPITGRRLKRLKRANDVVSTDNPPPEPVIDFVDPDYSGSLMSESIILQSLRLEQLEESRALFQQPEPGSASSEASEGKSGSGSEDSEPDPSTEVRRSLVFNSTDEVADEQLGARGQDESIDRQEKEEVGEIKSGDSELIPSDEDSSDEDGETEWKKKKKRTKRSNSATDDYEEMKAPATNKRREAKERREHLKQLHADSQRVLRETGDASFKPIPVVQKSISSVLEKIRQRKLEMSKKNVTMKNNASLFSRYIDVSDDDNNVDFEPVDLIALKGKGENITKAVPDDMVSGSTEAKTVFETGSTEVPKDMEDEPSSANDTVQKSPSGEQAFRAPIDDTQELFSDSQASGSIDESPTDSPGSPLEENFALSVLAMNLKLKLDSAPMISDDENNDKENVDPHLRRAVDASEPLKDPARNFLDEEAEEEYDSDNDPFHRQENEDGDEDAEDAQELNDMIATNFVEKPIDGEMRNELHQKWLEQQDTVGMKKLLQKIKGGPKDREPAMLDDEDEDDHVEGEEENDMDDDEDDSDDDNADTLATKSMAQLNLRRMKQMMPKVFADKDDPYISSEDEEYERTLAKQSLFKKAEGKSTFLSPEENETSREVFHRIKIKKSSMPDTKKRAKTSALPDLLQTSVKSNCFQKPSFVGRGSNSSLPSKNKKTSAVRSFIFSRGDSNSKSSSTTEVSETVVEESRPVRPPTAKFSSSASQSKFSSSQITKVSSDTSNSTTSYILRHSSMRSTEHCVRETVDVRAEAMFAAFRVEKRGRDGRILT